MKAIKFLVYSNIWISAGAALLTLLSFRLYGYNPDYKFAGFVFFSTLFSYNFQRVSRLKNIAVQSPDSWVVNHSSIAKLLLVVSFLGAIILVPDFNYPFVLFWLIMAGLISFGYSFGNFRNIPYLKILLISVSWVIICGIIPQVISDSSLPTSPSFLWIFFYILAITIPFDIRDLGIDEDSKKTIPQWIGTNKAKKIAWISLGISFLFILTFSSLIVSGLFLLNFLIVGYLINESSEKKEDLYFTFLIDGHIILQFLLVYFLC
jgi:hypothetical protein